MEVLICHYQQGLLFPYHPPIWSVYLPLVDYGLDDIFKELS